MKDADITPADVAPADAKLIDSAGTPAPFAPPYRAPAPEACADMREVRAGVDEIDRMLVTLLTRRQGYMDAAARIKPARSAVRDEARIEQVLDNVRGHAAQSGLSWEIAEPVWRTLVERCIAYEFVVYDRLRAGQKPGDDS